MTNLVNSLPTRTASDPGTFRVLSNANENNVITAAQIAVARSKYWNPKMWNGSTWVDLLTVNNSGATLYKGRLPRGIRRYLKAEAKVTTGLGEANTVFAEITDAIENDLDMNLVQKSSETDQAAAGDAVRAVVEA